MAMQRHQARPGRARAGGRLAAAALLAGAACGGGPSGRTYFGRETLDVSYTSPTTELRSGTQDTLLEARAGADAAYLDTSGTPAMLRCGPMQRLLGTSSDGGVLAVTPGQRCELPPAVRPSVETEAQLVLQVDRAEPVRVGEPQLLVVLRGAVLDGASGARVGTFDYRYEGTVP